MMKNRQKKYPLLITLLIVLLFWIISASSCSGRDSQLLSEPDSNDLPAAYLVPEIEPTTPAPVSRPAPNLRISELMVRNHTVLQAPDGSFPDWVEIYNADSVPVDLSGWRLSDKHTGGYLLPEHILQPGEYFIIFADGSGRVEEDVFYADFSLSPKDTVYFFTPDGILADRMESGIETANHSLSRGEDGDVFETKYPTPGLPNTQTGIEAWSESLNPSGPLSINEVVVENYSTVPQNGQFFDWVEIKNISDTTVLLSEYYLSDNEDEMLLFRLPEQTLEPGSTILVFCSGREDLSFGESIHTNFKLDGREEDLFLSDSERVVDYVYLRDVPPGGSLGRHPDKAGWHGFLNPTPGAENGDILPYIDKTYLRAGDSLRVKNASGFSFKYYVDDEEVLTGELVLDEAWYERWITVKAFRNGQLISEDTAYFSRLPVLYINTSGGNEIRKTAYLNGTMLIQNNVDSDYYEYAGIIQIHGRGNSSWAWPKKPYRIKLESKSDLYSMGANKNWLLVANYLDESLLRNNTGSQISAQFGLVSMESVWADIILNGQYVGNYQLFEQVRLGESRIDIFDWEEEAERVAAAVWETEQEKGNKLDLSALEKSLKQDLRWATNGSFTFCGRKYTISEYTVVQGDISGGYLFELSAEYDEPSKFKTDTGIKIMLKSPKELRTNAVMTAYVREYWNALDRAWRSEDGYAETSDGRKHYTEMVDLDSMVAFWLTNEIIGNNDANHKSRFAYKNIGEPIRFGPVWDYDWGCGSIKTPSDGEGWVLATNAKKQSFFKDLLDDPLFIVRATEMYWSIHPYLEDLVREGGILEKEAEYLLESGLADQIRWDRKKTWPENAQGFEQGALMFRQYLRQRIDWLDTMFETDSVLLDSVRTLQSTCPYTRDENVIIAIPSAGTDTFSAHAPAEATMHRNEDVSLSVTVETAGAEYLDVYVNGLFDQSVAVRDGGTQFVVAAARLTAEGKNTISLIARNGSGKTVGRNFTTVLVLD